MFPTGLGTTDSLPNGQKAIQQRKPTNTKPESLTQPSPREKRRLDLVLSERTYRGMNDGRGLRQSRLLKQSGDLHSGHYADATGEVFHLVGELFVDAPRRFIHRRA